MLKIYGAVCLGGVKYVFFLPKDKVIELCFMQK